MRRIKTKIYNSVAVFVAVIFLVVFSVAAGAKSADPIEVMRGITSRVMSELRKNQKAISVNPSKVYDVVDHLVLPHVDFIEMSKWVAGKSAWHNSSPSQQEEFVKEFRTLVIRTYAVALNKYTNEKVEFDEYRGGLNKRIQISSSIIRDNRDNIRVDYRLIMHGNSWRVYDIIIEGVSILKGFQAQFSDKIRRQGIAKVTQELHQHNKEGL